MDRKVELSEQFAIRVVNCYKFLCREKQEFVMSKQLLRAGTSIGANIAESLASESEDDFIHKLTIAQKEASETKYWLTLLFKTDFLSEALYHSLTNDCMELLRILSAIIVKMKSKHKKTNTSNFLKFL